MSVITITLTGGTSPIYANRHGVCDDGAYWTEFDVDYLAEQIDGQCEICNKTINNGWLCLDGSEEACNECVTVIETDDAEASLTTGDIYRDQYSDTYGTF